MTTRYGVKYRTTQEGYTGGIADSYRLAAAYASAHGGTVYEVGSRDDPETSELPHGPICTNDDHYPLYGKHRVSECATTKRAQVQEENFDDLC